MRQSTHRRTPSLLAAATGLQTQAAPESARLTLGVLPGEGIGPDLTDQACRVLEAIEAVGDARFEIVRGGPIGLESRATCGRDLSEDVEAFCQEVFDRGGAILAGPGGGRFVYELRDRFDLYCKFSPIAPCAELADIRRVRDISPDAVDMLVVRENCGGVYQGQAEIVGDNGDDRIVRHSFSYSAAQVRRIAHAGARAAAGRRGSVTLVVKAGALPEMTALWTDATREACEAAGVDLATIDVDHCAYQLIHRPDSFDVLITPNLLGDILSDLSAALLGSRGISYSGNFCPQGRAVYQTNHGAAHDLAGLDRANPAGHLFALAMLLRESFGLDPEATLIEQATRDAWQAGRRTADVATDDQQPVGTAAFVDFVTDAIHSARGKPA